MPDCHWKRGSAALLLAAALAIGAPLQGFAEDQVWEQRDGVPEWTETTEEAEPEPDETPASQTPVSQSTDSRAALLNSIPLDPAEPQSQALRAYLDQLMPTIVDDSMDTYQKVKACYDYVYANTSYGSNMSNLGAVVWDGVTCNSIYNTYGEIEGFGAVALTAGVGMCNAYNSAFILMIREIGLEPRLVEGSTKGGGGNYVYHKWTELTIDGTVYLFDPQVEQGMVRSGMPMYSVFCKTYDQLPGRYIK